MLFLSSVSLFSINKHRSQLLVKSSAQVCIDVIMKHIWHVKVFSELVRGTAALYYVVAGNTWTSLREQYISIIALCPSLFSVAPSIWRWFLAFFSSDAGSVLCRTVASEHMFEFADQCNIAVVWRVKRGWDMCFSNDLTRWPWHIGFQL